MKRLILIVEGQTEEDFVRDVLTNYFNGLGIDVRATQIPTSSEHKGGFVEYAHLRNVVLKILKKESEIVVSTMLDFFKIPTSVPNYEEMDKYPNVDDKIDCLLKGIIDDINDYRFIPYIQKYEFEALLFSSEEGFSLMFDEVTIIQTIKEIIDKYDNPEEINNHPNTAPSKRLIKITKTSGVKYEKVVMGSLIAQEIGIQKIMEKCPRFRNWILLLTNRLKDGN